MEKKISFSEILKKYTMVIVLVFVVIMFSVNTKGVMLLPQNVNNLVAQNAYVFILATGMLFCILTGGNIDLSVGSVVCFVAAVGGKMMVLNSMNPYLTMIVMLLVGIAIGAWQGFWIAYVRIPPFIVTLAGMLIGRGLTYTLLESKTVGPLPDAYVKVGAGFFITNKIQMGSGTLDIVCIIVAIVATALIILSELKSIKTRQKYGLAIVTPWQTIVKLAIIIAIVWFFFYKLARYNGIPIVLIIMAVIVGIYHFITSKTVPGRQIYALGGNAKAARLSGIDTRKVFFWVYTNMGFLAAIAGIVLSARNASATPKAGDGFELDAIASCYIGGAAAAGGIGTVIGAVVGAFVMGVLNNGMFLIGLSTDLQKVVKGLVLLGAVTFDILSNKKKK